MGSRCASCEFSDGAEAALAGNVANADLLGSLEFACAVSGAKGVLVMGHTHCGATRARLGALLEKIEPAVAATRYDGERSAKNAAFVDAVAETNVRLTLERIRQDSPVLAGLEKDGRTAQAGARHSARALSSMRLEKPHSLSYQAMTLTSRPLTRVWLASNTAERGSWLKSTDTSGRVL